MDCHKNRAVSEHIGLALYDQSIMVLYGQHCIQEGILMADNENYLTIESWYRDIQKKGNSLAKIPESERTLEKCFVAIHY